MTKLRELLEDDDKQLSCYRLGFLIGVVGLLGLAVLQFFGYGSIPTALYGILATMASGGYVAGKYVDSTYSTTQPDATDGDINGI